MTQTTVVDFIPAASEVARSDCICLSTTASLLKATSKTMLETFMAVVQRTGADSKPRIPHVVSKSDRDHGSATTAHRTLGLLPAGTICSSNLYLGLYPIHSTSLFKLCRLNTH